MPKACNNLLDYYVEKSSSYSRAQYPEAKAYNLLNAIGLATGISCGLIIALHIQEELSYEKNFPEYENIYRVHEHQWAKSSPPMIFIAHQAHLLLNKDGCRNQEGGSNKLKYK